MLKVGSYIKFIGNEDIESKGLITDKYKLYQINYIAFTTNGVVYWLTEIETNNMRFVTFPQLNQNFILAKSANILFR